MNSINVPDDDNISPEELRRIEEDLLSDPDFMAEEEEEYDDLGPDDYGYRSHN